MLVTFAIVVGLFGGVAAVVFSVALLQRTCAIYDLTGQEAKCSGTLPVQFRSEVVQLAR